MLLKRDALFQENSRLQNLIGTFRDGAPVFTIAKGPYDIDRITKTICLVPIKVVAIETKRMHEEHKSNSLVLLEGKTDWIEIEGVSAMTLAKILWGYASPFNTGTSRRDKLVYANPYRVAAITQDSCEDGSRLDAKLIMDNGVEFRTSTPRSFLIRNYLLRPEQAFTAAQRKALGVHFFSDYATLDEGGLTRTTPLTQDRLERLAYVDSLMPTFTQINSKMISAVGYDAEKQAMQVAFKPKKNGLISIHIFPDVPENVYQEFLDTDSKGSYFLQNLKLWPGQFKSDEVSPDELDKIINQP